MEEKTLETMQRGELDAIIIAIGNNYCKFNVRFVPNKSPPGWNILTRADGNVKN
jgi:hypothetical protein